MLFFVPVPEIDWIFLIVLVIRGVLNAFVSVIYIKAIKISPLSLTLPMLTFTPIFLLLTSPLIVGEFPSIIGVLGIILIVLGAYTLNIKDVKKGFFSPFKSLVKEKGPKNYEYYDSHKNPLNVIKLFELPLFIYNDLKRL